MRIWRFIDPCDVRYAAAARRGAWTESDGACSECGTAGQKRTNPLVLVWEPGSDLVGDFVWPGFGSEVVATEPVVEALERDAGGFERGPVEIRDEPDETGREQRRVQVPYKGPALFELWTTSWVDADLARSTMTLESVCGTCGTERWQLQGAERVESHFDRSTNELVRARVPRDRAAGIRVGLTDLAGAGVFRIRQLPGWVICTDLVRDLIRSQGYSNVSFLEVGEAE